MASSGDNGHDPGEDLLEHDDLEQYGVWVKTAPEDVDEDTDTLDPVEDVDLEASPLTAEEEELLAPLESDSQQETPEPASDDFADFNLDDIEDISLDDLDESDGTPGESSAVLAQDDSDSVEFDVDALDLDLDDLEIEEAADLSDDDGEEVSLDLEDVDFDDIELADIEGPSAEEENTPAQESDVEDELSDFELDDISLADENEDPEIEEEPESSESLPELELEEEELNLELIEEEDLADDSDDLHSVDDVAAVESEMTDTEEFDVEDMSSDAPMAPQPQTSAAEESILAKIEGELSAIKRELTDLRSELSTLRSRNKELEDTESQPEPVVVREQSDAEGDSGFFEDEDEDETIALTGAELDNILNTAEFTEEDGQPDEIDDAEIEIADKPVAEAAPAEIEEQDDELLDLEIEEPAEDIGIGVEVLEPDSIESEVEDDGSFVDLELDEEEIGEESDADETVEDFEATLGYADQVAPAPTNEESVQSAEIGDSLAERESELVEEEINFELDEDDDIIPLDTEPDSEPVESLESVDFEDTGDDTDSAAIEEIELEELDEEPEESAPEVLDAAVPSLDEFEDTSATSVDEEDTLPDLDIDAELVDIGELSDEPEEIVESPSVGQPAQPREPMRRPAPESERTSGAMGDDLKSEIRSVLSYMDQLLESLPEEKIEEFARSEHFEVYRKLFEELGLER